MDGMIWEINKLNKKGYGRYNILKALKEKNIEINESKIRSILEAWNFDYRAKEYLLVVIGDLHFGNINLNIPKFKEIYFRNLKKILDRISMVSDIQEVILIDIGDAIENIKHTSQLEENTLLIQEAKKEYRRFLRELIEIVEPHRIYVQIGNHDRTEEYYPTLNNHIEEIYDFINEFYNIPISISLKAQKFIIGGWGVIIKHDSGLRTNMGNISINSLKNRIQTLRSQLDSYDPNTLQVQKSEIFIFGHIHRLGIFPNEDFIVYFNGTACKKNFHIVNVKDEDLGQLVITLPHKKKALNSNGKLNLSIGNPYIIWVEE
jgi:DNA-directed RNA polymerase beta' subunit